MWSLIMRMPSPSHSSASSCIRKGCLGAMYWDYDSDDEKGTLRHAVYQWCNESLILSVYFFLICIFSVKRISRLQYFAF